MEDRASVLSTACSESGAIDEERRFSLFGVFDGHGGQEVSSFLSMHMHQLGAEEMCKDLEDTSNATEALRRAFERADYLVRDLATGSLSSNPTRSDPGSTAVVALLMGQSVFVANTGNSRAFICSSRHGGDSIDAQANLEGGRDISLGELRPIALSRPHQVSQPDERSRLIQAGASISDGRVPRLEGDLELSRAFGDLRYHSIGLISEPETQARNLQPGDRLLILASDGVFEVMQLPEICSHAHAVASGRAHPPLSPPRPPAIPLLSPRREPSWLWEWIKRIQPLSPRGILRGLAAWSLSIIRTLRGRQSRRTLHSSTTHPHAGLEGCCDCGDTASVDTGATRGLTILSSDPCSEPYKRRRRGGPSSSRSLFKSQRLESGEAYGPETLAAAVSYRIMTEAFNRGSMDNIAVIVADLATQDKTRPSYKALPAALEVAVPHTFPHLNLQRRHPQGDRSSDSIFMAASSADLFLPAAVHGRELELAAPRAMAVLNPGTRILRSCPAGSPQEEEAICYWTVERQSKVSGSSRSQSLQSGEALYELTVRIGDVPSPLDRRHMSNEDGGRSRNIVEPMALDSLQRSLSWQEVDGQKEAGLHQLLIRDQEPAMQKTGILSSATSLFLREPLASITSLEPWVGILGSICLANGDGASEGTCTSDDSLSKDDYEAHLGLPAITMLQMPAPSDSALASPQTSLPLGRSGRTLLFDSESHMVSDSVLLTEDSFAQKNPSVPGLNEGPHFQLLGRLGQGHFGEVWRGIRSMSEPGSAKDPLEKFVLKRLLVELGDRVRLSGFRESYFGKLLKKQQQILASGITVETEVVPKPTAGLEHIVRFVESFTMDTLPIHPRGGPPAGAEASELWLVFHDEGMSLHDHLYAAEAGSASTAAGDGLGFEILGPSPWWKELRGQPMGGLRTVQSILKQLLQALESLHSLGIVHRDVKPENLMLVKRPSAQLEGCKGRADGTDPCIGEAYHARLIDFGSAIDEDTLQNLYGLDGPSAEELTLEYAPPESLFGRFWEGSRSLKASAKAMDIWAVGVVWLEILLGTPHVFSLPAHTRSRLDAKLKSAGRPPEESRESFYLIRGLMEWCIYPPQVPGKHRSRKEVVSWSCTEAALQKLIRARDPSGVGISSIAGLRLLFRLLHFEPSMRPTAAQALKHAFFMHPIVENSAGSEPDCAPFGQAGWC